AIWASGTFWWQIPRTIQVVLEGRLPAGVSGKDLIITLCGLYSQGEVLNAAVEFVGPGVATLSMEERLAVSNMTTEWGALVGWFPADEITVAYLRDRMEILAERGVERVAASDLAGWLESPLLPDDDAAYAGRITLNLSTIVPHIAGPDTVQIATPLPEMEKERIEIHKAYLVSCVNSRTEDIAAAAAVLAGKKIAAGVEFYLAAASREVQATCERQGTWQTLLDAGARPLPPGCGPCIGLGAGLLEAGEVGISATNRNFKGRMGSREAKCYLASPAVVAASAVAGYICGPAPFESTSLESEFLPLAPPAAAAEEVEILPGFPQRVQGRLIFLPQDNLNTDGIYGKDYTYRDDMTPEMMAEVVFENYDPGFAGQAQAGDVLVGARNFGTGSSREQAVTALQAKGIAMIIAGSYSQTYLRNAFNNGFPCIACPELVDRVRELLAGEIEGGGKTLIPGDEIEIDFAAGTILFRNETFSFPPLGVVPQALVVAGGVENKVRQELGIG
ncbi:MAG: aconitase family protein, partial [Thermoanaerobaculia bacterium]